MKLPDILNGWQRIGIVVSVLWFAFSGFITYSAYDKYLTTRTRDQQSQTAVADCREQAKKGANSAAPPRPDCGLSIPEFLGETASPPALVKHVALFIVPVALGWLLVYAALGVFRWVSSGFRRQ